MKLISVRETATRLGLSIARVHQLIREGQLKAQKVGNMWVIDPKDLAAVKVRPKPGRPQKKKTVRKKKA